ncbi:MAG: SDR family oxidoreductase [Ignavibacteriae bacterium]|nr:SDR family oxidoreductase [Ignavibacteriota bacterium]NOG97957.1 SDR family oxidoreductase [Ignavibacteriota bacterium]
MKKVLLAGATGYLGKFILDELQKRDYSTVALTRNRQIDNFDDQSGIEIKYADVTKPETLSGICKGVDYVISTVGITKQKDGLTYMDVDYQANLNLLNEAINNGVSKFIYVSVLNGEKLRHLKICEAKEKFVDDFKNSGIDYSIIRPNGFFSDMSEFHTMASKGKIYLFGDGEYKVNPIHGEDLAEICVKAIEQNKTEIEVGGPEILTHNQIAETAFAAVGKPVKISHIPNSLRKIILSLIRTFTSSKTYGPIEFFMTVMAMDMVASKNGKHSLKEYFAELTETGKNNE